MDSRAVRFVPSAMAAGADYGPLRRDERRIWRKLVRVAAPEGGQGFWVRYTVRIAPGEEASGSLWFTWFDAAGPVADRT